MEALSTEAAGTGEIIGARESGTRLRSRKEAVPNPKDTIPRTDKDSGFPLFQVHPGQSHPRRQDLPGGLRTMKLAG